MSLLPVPAGGKLGDIIVDEDYLAHLREQVCGLCGALAPSDPHHVKPRAWREAKRQDYLCLPVCRRCHNLIGNVGLAEALRRLNVEVEDLVATLVMHLVRYLRHNPGVADLPF